MEMHFFKPIMSAAAPSASCDLGFKYKHSSSEKQQKLRQNTNSYPSFAAESRFTCFSTK